MLKVEIKGKMLSPDEEEMTKAGRNLKGTVKSKIYVFLLPVVPYFHHVCFMWVDKFWRKYLISNATNLNLKVMFFTLLLGETVRLLCKILIIHTNCK